MIHRIRMILHEYEHARAIPGIPLQHYSDMCNLCFRRVSAMIIASQRAYIRATNALLSSSSHLRGTIEHTRISATPHHVSLRVFVRIGRMENCYSRIRRFKQEKTRDKTSSFRSFRTSQTTWHRFPAFAFRSKQIRVKGPCLLSKDD